jgi:hypothetical protein
MRATATALRHASEPRLALGNAARRVDEGELPGLLHDRADVARILARGGAVEDHFGDRELTFDGLAARFEIDGAGEAILVAAAGLLAGISEDQFVEAAAGGGGGGDLGDGRPARRGGPQAIQHPRLLRAPELRLRRDLRLDPIQRRVDRLRRGSLERGRGGDGGPGAFGL